jgi:DNA invertase Pin-like site-specific DNA recombinase
MPVIGYARLSTTDQNLSVIGVHGVSKKNASTKQAEKCYHNHRTHPYATLRHRSDLSASCLTKLVF